MLSTTASFSANRARESYAGTPVSYRHSLWRIALILFTLFILVLACIFNGLSSSGPNRLFDRRTGSISDENLTEITPSGQTFAIWGVIYFWQFAWILYAIGRIPQKSNYGFLYMEPNTLHFTVFVFYSFNMALNIAWLFLWDRLYFGWSLLVIFFMLLTVVIPLIITHVLLERNRPLYVKSRKKWDIWLVRIFVHNGLMVYATWLFLATLLNLTIWISRIYDRRADVIMDTSTAALSVVLAAVVIYFILENFVFYSAMAYTYLAWFVLIFAFAGITSKNYQRTDVSSRNKAFGLALLILSSALLVLRILIFVFRYVRGTIPTLRNP